jgi:hypothetical protein
MPADRMVVEEQPAVEEAPPTVESAPVNRRTLWLVLLALLALAGLTVCALVSLSFIPMIRERVETLPVLEQTSVLPAVVDDTNDTPEFSVATDIAPTALPTAAAVATTMPTVSPFPTITPLVEVPSPTPIIGIIMPSPLEAGTPATGGEAINVLQNGDFSDDWVDGWSLEAGETNGSRVIERLPPGFDVPGQVLSMGKTGSGTVQLSQRAVLNDRTGQAIFRARVRQTGTVNEAEGLEGRSAIILVYESADGTPQGASIWFDSADDQTGLWSAPPLSELGPNLMARYAVNNDWQDIEITLEDEFGEHLPDIDPADVRQVTVMLLLMADDDCPPGSCMTTLEAADLQLMMPFP